MKGLTYRVNPAGWAACLLLKRLWPGCLLTRLNGLELAELPPPALPGPEWVLCKTLLGGICGTDLSLVQQKQPADSILQGFSTLPAVLGHENVAVVAQVGEAVDAAWLGKRVCVEPTLCCGPRGIEPACGRCQQGQYGACENFSASGSGSSRLPPGTSIGYCGAVGGSWGECFTAHVSQLVEPPAKMSDELAVLTDPLACSLHAVLRAELSSARQVLVYGAGVLGLGAVWALRALGYADRIDVIARHPHQGRLARQLGADEVLALPRRRRAAFETIAQRTGGRVSPARLGNCMLSGGYDVVFEAAGVRQSMEQALKFARSRGQVILLATGHGRGVDLTSVWFTELTVIGAYGRSVESVGGRQVHTYRLAQELMLKDAAKLRPLLTHTFGLEQYRQALAVAADKAGSESVKVAFLF